MRPWTATRPRTAGSLTGTGWTSVNWIISSTWSTRRPTWRWPTRTRRNPLAGVLTDASTGKARLQCDPPSGPLARRTEHLPHEAQRPAYHKWWRSPDPEPFRFPRLHESVSTLPHHPDRFR